jgi:hypothetical protein
VEQTAVAEHKHREDTPAELAEFDKVAKSGWDFFTKFLLWNVVACVATLVLIGFLTVWS